MDRSVADILTERGRLWDRRPPASRAAIEHLRSSVAFELPQEYIELLEFSDGGFGKLDAAPLLFDLDSISDAIAYNESDFRKKFFADFWFFGDNGGMERIAFDLREGPPWRIVMIDPIAGPDSAEVIAENMAKFVPKIGLIANR